MLDADDVLVAGRGDEDVGGGNDVLELHHFKTVHGGLQGADRVDFRDLDAGTGTAQRSGRALADVAVAADHGDLAGHHDVGAAADAVDQRFLAAILVVELRLGDRVVHVDRREGQEPLLLQLVETVDAGRGLFGNALDGIALLGEPARGKSKTLLDLGEEDLFFFRARIGQHVLAGFGACAEQDIHGGVAAVVQDHVGETAIGPLEDLVGVFPVFRQRLALYGVDRDAGGRDGCGGVVLRGEDVARGPANVRTQRHQRLDEHGGLDGHVQRAGDARALERFGCAELFAAGHQARHFRLGDLDFLAAEIGKRDVGDVVVMRGGHEILQPSGSG